MKLSVILITLNEEKNIARALRSVSFADEVVVVDSFSQDRTREIAEEMGAKVIQEKFLGYGQQKNLALKYCSGDWVLWIDADEEISPELAQNIKNAIIQSNLFDSYRLNRRTEFVGKWIYHGGWYPDFIIRLFKRKKAKFSEPEVHEEVLPENPQSVGKLEGHINHYSFPTLQSQVLTNVKYAKLGANQLALKSHGKPGLLKLFFKPLGKFLECYILKKGFMDGSRGFIIAINAAHSIFMKYATCYLEEKNEKPN